MLTGRRPRGDGLRLIAPDLPLEIGGRDGGYAHRLFRLMGRHPRRSRNRTSGGRLPEVGAGTGRWLDLFQQLTGAANGAIPNARCHLHQFGVSDLARLMNLFAGETDVGSGWLKSVLVWNAFWTPLRDFATLLGRVVFVGQT